MHKPRNKMRKNRRGFTLIELMIVIGIIAVLVAVLALAVLPWLTKSAENSTKTLMGSVGSMLNGEKNPLTIEKFRKDAGPLASQISSDPKIASAQLMMFYYCPTKEAWTKAPLYKGRSYAPQVEPKEWADFTRIDGSAADLPYLCDGWDQPLWYLYDKTNKTILLRSPGKDTKYDTDDDWVFDGRSSRVVLWNDIKK